MSRVLLEKLLNIKTVKKLLAIYGTFTLIIVFAGGRHRSLFEPGKCSQHQTTIFI